MRNRETTLGKVMADAFKDVLDVDVMLLGSGSIRRDELGPIVTYQDIREVLPYNDPVHMLTVTGKQLRHMTGYALRDETGGQTPEYYQYSRGFRVEYDRKKHEIRSMSLNGYEIKDNEQIRIGLQDYHLANIKKFLDVSLEEVSQICRPKVLSTSCTDVVEEYFSRQELVRASEEERLVFV